MRIKKHITLLAVLAAVLWAGGCVGSDFPGVEGLVERRVPWLAEHIDLRRGDGADDSFTLRADKGKLIVEATSPNAAAAGVNHYLRHFLHRSMSHMGITSRRSIRWCCPKLR